jgi:hypothetical protein
LSVPLNFDSRETILPPPETLAALSVRDWGPYKILQSTLLGRVVKAGYIYAIYPQINALHFPGISYNLGQNLVEVIEY